MFKRFREILEEQKLQVRRELPMIGSTPNPQLIWNQALERALVLFIDERIKENVKTETGNKGSRNNKSGHSTSNSQSE